MLILAKMCNRIKDIGFDASGDADKFKINYGHIYF